MIRRDFPFFFQCSFAAKGMHPKACEGEGGHVNAGGEAALSLGPGTKLPPSVLIGQAEALSTVPGGGRALAYMFPGRLLDRLHPQLGMGVQTGKVGRDRWEVFSLSLIHI